VTSRLSPGPLSLSTGVTHCNLPPERRSPCYRRALHQ
jgi:hypothetical protein